MDDRCPFFKADEALFVIVKFLLDAIETNRDLIESPVHFGPQFRNRSA